MGKRGPQPKPNASKGHLGIRCHAKWYAWVKKFAEHRRVSPTVLVDHALVELAERTGYDPPPKR